jgi:transposase
VVGDEVFTRRRCWTWDEKRAVVAKAISTGNVLGVAKQHGIQAQQIYRWRDRLSRTRDTAEFVAVSLNSDSLALPAPDGAPSEELVDCQLGSGSGFGERVEIAVGDGLVIRLTPGSNADFLVQVVAGLMRCRL